MLLAAALTWCSALSRGGALTSPHVEVQGGTRHSVALRGEKKLARSVHARHLYQAVVKSWPSSHVGQPLACELVDIAAVQPEFAPPDAQAVDDAGACTHRNHRFATVFTACVENTHQVASLDIARAGVVGSRASARFESPRAACWERTSIWA